MTMLGSELLQCFLYLSSIQYSRWQFLSSKIWSFHIMGTFFSRLNEGHFDFIRLFISIISHLLFPGSKPWTYLLPLLFLSFVGEHTQFSSVSQILLPISYFAISSCLLLLFTNAVNYLPLIGRYGRKLIMVSQIYCLIIRYPAGYFFWYPGYPVSSRIAKSGDRCTPSETILSYKH